MVLASLSETALTRFIEIKDSWRPEDVPINHASRAAKTPPGTWLGPLPCRPAKRILRKVHRAFYRCARNAYACEAVAKAPRSKGLLVLLRAFLRPRWPLHRGQRFEIGRHCSAILRAEQRGVLDHFAHRTADAVAVGGLSGF